MKTVSALFFGVLVVCIFALVLWTSLDFQQCIKSYGQNDPAYRHCIGAYVTDKNAVITALGTLVIAVFTTVLGIFTISLARSTRIAANAADLSVKIAQRALTELERPYLFILDYNWLLTEKAKADGLKCGLVYTVANGGKLPAFIKAVKLGIRFSDSIPSMVDEPLVHDLLTAPLIAGGEQRRVIQGIADEEGDEEGSEPALECQIRGGMALIPGSVLRTGRVIAKISIEYDGPITTGHVTTACWEWHPVKHAFTQYGGPGHNQRT